MNKDDYKFLFGINLGNYNDLHDKELQTNYYISYMMARTRRMFEWKGLPKTVSVRNMEMYVQSNGKAALAEHQNKLYTFFGSFGGKPNEYYLPTEFIVSNPYLHFNKSLRIGEECVLIPNDTMFMGMLPMAENYASRMVDSDISIRLATIISRVGAAIVTGSDNDKKAAEKFLKGLEDGKLGHLPTSTSFLSGINSLSFENGERTITQLIELRQYLKASWFNDVGINANYNMKREAVNSNEAEMDNDSLLPFCDDMLECRKTAAKEATDMFSHLLDSEITVDYSSAWKKMRDANKFEMEILENEADNVQSTGQEDEVDSIQSTGQEDEDETK